MLPSTEASFHAGAEDPRCPIPGIQEAISRAANAYEEAGSAEKFKVTMPTKSFRCSLGVTHDLSLI